MKNLDFLVFKALGYNPKWTYDFDESFEVFDKETNRITITNGQASASVQWCIPMGNQEATDASLKRLHSYVRDMELGIKEIKAILAKTDEEKKQIIFENFDTILNMMG